MEKTIIQLKAELQEIALKHKQINGFFFGQFNDAFNLEEKLLFPVMICQLLPGSMTKKSVKTSVSIAILDKITEEDFDQQTEVLSDTQQICADIKNIFSSYRFEDYTFEDNSIALEPIIEERPDLVSGWVMNFTIDSFDSSNYCSIPIEDYDFENSPFVDCSTGTLPLNSFNVNGGLFSSFPNNTDLNLTVKDSDGVEVGSKVGEEWIVPTAETKTLRFLRRPPAEKISYAMYDPAWFYQQGILTELGENEYYQQIGNDFWTVRYDDSALTGITAHKYRFIGINGGYLVVTSGNTIDVFDKNGVVSNLVTEFSKDGGLFMIDRLSGLGMAFGASNQYPSNDGNTIAQVLAILNDTHTLVGYTGGWFTPSYEDFKDVFYAGMYSYDLQNWWRLANVFDLETNQISSSPHISSPADNVTQVSLSSFSITIRPRTNTNSGRAFTPMRIFTEWNLLTD